CSSDLGFCGQFEINTHAVDKQSNLINQILTSSGDSFHMNISIIALFQTKFFHHTQHSLHRVICIFEDSRTQEQALNIIPTVKVHRDFDDLIYCKSSTSHIIASAADTKCTVVNAMICQ